MLEELVPLELQGVEVSNDSVAFRPSLRGGFKRRRRDIFFRSRMGRETGEFFLPCAEIDRSLTGTL